MIICWNLTTENAYISYEDMTCGESMKIRQKIGMAILLAADVLLVLLLFGGYRQKEDEVLSTVADIDEKTVSEVKKIALTFDDGPNGNYTMPLLEGLRERNVKATFFLLGQEVTEHPEIAKKIAQDGHMIGNHSYYHKDLRKMTSEEAIMQVCQTNEVIYKVTGQYPQLLRPPFGKIPKNLVFEPPMVEVLWTIDSRDWELSDVGTIMQNVLPYVKENAIILMHDASASSVQAALAIVDELKEKGYSFVTLDEILFD